MGKNVSWIRNLLIYPRQNLVETLVTVSDFDMKMCFGFKYLEEESFFARGVSW